MITTNNCCFCISLKTGCLVIGVLLLIGSFGDLITRLSNGPSGPSNDSGWFWQNIIFDVIHIFAASCLIFGVNTGRRRFIFYYLIVAVALLGWGIVQSIIIVATSNDVAIVGITLLFVLALDAYFSIVVYSHYKELSVA